MLFNSYAFIFGFLPIAVFGFFHIGRYSHNLASLWLAAASLFFYGWWDARFVGLLLGSIVFNYGAGHLIRHRILKSNHPPKLLFISAIASNLILLGYFKYASFFVENVNRIVGTTLAIGDVFLPLGISFFTFTQIVYLVDIYQGKVRTFNFFHYTLFVTYFPHLIAGPVLHHKEMMPQFAKRDTCQINWENMAVGLSIFVLGLAKKVLLADSLADFSTPIFDSLTWGWRPMLLEAWVGALSYTLQLYFDFSGYSDMAIGLSLMFNVYLPLNFNSPYKATSIIEFWRRWHISLSRFLRDYLYIPLGGNHNGIARRYLNLMITMLLGGLWHGAGWTFIIWGGLHGFCLIVNHTWRELKQRMDWNDGAGWSNFAAGTLTFLTVVTGWVIFRADNFASAMAMLQGMAGMNGLSLPASLEPWWKGHFDGLPLEGWLEFQGMLPMVIHSGPVKAIVVIVLGLAIVFNLPNLQQVMANYKSVLDGADKLTARRSRLVWSPSLSNALLIFLLGFFVLINMHKPSPFLYFQF